MGLVLKYVEQTKSGSWQYRRRVPKAVASLILKREFKAKLGDSKKEALTAWPSVHARVEREIAAAEERLAISLALENGMASEREAYAEAQRRRTDLIAAGADEAELIYVGASIADSCPHGHYTPLNASPVDYHTINLLRLGPDRHRPPRAEP